MNPFRTPIRFWLADWLHERRQKKANRERRKDGWSCYIRPPSQQPKEYIFHKREPKEDSKQILVDQFGVRGLQGKWKFIVGKRK